MTPTQSRIVAYMEAKGARWSTGADIADACLLHGGSPITVQTHINRLRCCGVAVETGRKPGQGYRIARSSRDYLTNRVSERVLGHVSERTGVSVDQIIGLSRKSREVIARKRAARLFRRLGYRLPEIGIAMNRDHSTILHHVGRLSR